MEGQAHDLIDLSSPRSEGGSRPASRLTFWQQKVSRPPQRNLGVTGKASVASDQAMLFWLLLAFAVIGLEGDFAWIFASATCRIFRQRARRPRRVSARQRTYFLPQESKQRAGPCCPVPPAAPAGSVGTRGETNNRLRPNSCRPPESTRVSAPAARGSGCGQRCHRTALHRELTCRRLSERSGVPHSELGGSAA